MRLLCAPVCDKLLVYHLRAGVSVPGLSHASPGGKEEPCFHLEADSGELGKFPPVLEPLDSPEGSREGSLPWAESSPSWLSSPWPSHQLPEEGSPLPPADLETGRDPRLCRGLV